MKPLVRLVAPGTFAPVAPRPVPEVDPKLGTTPERARERHGKPFDVRLGVATWVKGPSVLAGDALERLRKENEARRAGR